MNGLYDRDLVDALARNTIGKPASLCTWQELLTVRDVINELLNAAVNARQLDPASTSPDRPMLQPDVTGSKAASESPSRPDLPAPTPPDLMRAGRVGSGGHHSTDRAAARGTSQEVTKCWQ